MRLGVTSEEDTHDSSERADEDADDMQNVFCIQRRRDTCHIEDIHDPSDYRRDYDDEPYQTEATYDDILLVSAHR